jgi:hypothetical protein
MKEPSPAGGKRKKPLLLEKVERNSYLQKEQEKIFR